MKACYHQALSLSRRFSASSQLRSLSSHRCLGICSTTTNTFSTSAVGSTTVNEQYRRWKSSSSSLSALDEHDLDDSLSPVGDLFSFPAIGDDIIGKTGSIRRSFGPQCNAEAMITCGGEALAAHASFDPNYARAKDWIRSHPVGPAVLSPVLISGLVGTLVEAAFPKSVAINSSMQFLQPLIVGVEVRAKIQVITVATTGGSNTLATAKEEEDPDDDPQNEVRKRKHGHQVDLKTQVFRINDEIVIAEGTHSVWIPDYLHM
ncbi:expressed unknown protein [Seminavis robusta]|uniref:Uncharacterized protein n=1 Tax=Seminavis robusta TaxID=568900 RepID=A0A9N8HQQ3_9STRA|nr:expressed unknown protein [Seminavis robusta]|eukprot:Sro1313_g261930.1 n/a (261) ;mRNA; r:16532-17314